MEDLSNIPRFENWTKVTAVEKGWSRDRKYHIETSDGGHLLLRSSSGDSFEKKQRVFLLMQEVARCGVTMPLPIDFGAFSGGSVFTLLTWLEGIDASDVLLPLSEGKQYRLGLLAGEALGKIHSVPPPKPGETWESKYNRKIDAKIEAYRTCPVRLPREALFLEFIRRSRPLLNQRPQCIQHGDYHVGNLIVTPEGGIGVIDFDRLDEGDPWEEFNRIVFCAKASAAFASGRIDGYFPSGVPEGFFPLLALYIAVNTLSAISWAVPFGDKEVATMLGQAEDVLDFYDGFRSVVPRWYRAGGAP